jgi:hypothetical protein
VTLLRVGFHLEGLSFEPSGAATRLRSLLPALAGRPEVEVYISASSGSFARDLCPGASGFMKVPALSRSRVSRLLLTRRLLERFIATFALDLVQIEAPPFISNLPVPTFTTLHDLRFMHMCR